MATFYKTIKDKIILEITVQPKSSRNKIIGIHNDRLKISLTAPPVDNKANKACIEFLAKTLKISKSKLNIIKGNKNRNKTIELNGDIPELLEIIKEKFLNQ